ncbi:uncharacterized protein PSFLO_01963 [Pseudozyma flocculosa]|uniref:Uncharacterized protein n=1 Tax=Pseudozyma flocculosa TaxID=84751 RepID=A0A5C3EWP5_9BASI|nr:uncharacterized protein PSFLO_01963 [Pseudozyma flocculosa]
MRNRLPSDPGCDTYRPDERILGGPDSGCTDIFLALAPPPRGIHVCTDLPYPFRLVLLSGVCARQSAVRLPRLRLLAPLNCVVAARLGTCGPVDYVRGGPTRTRVQRTDGPTTVPQEHSDNRWRARIAVDQDASQAAKEVFRPLSCFLTIIIELLPSAHLLPTSSKCGIAPGAPSRSSLAGLRGLAPVRRERHGPRPWDGTMSAAFGSTHVVVQLEAPSGPWLCSPPCLYARRPSHSSS